MAERRARRITQQEWRRWTDWPLAGLAILFLIAYSWEVIGELHGVARRISEIVEWISWTAFAVDYVVSLALAHPRWRWFYTHLVDLAIVALPILRPLRLLRVAAAFTVLQRRVGTALRGRIVIFSIGAAALLIYVAALAELEAEYGHGGAVQTIGDALWWAIVTITTVGYGDSVPVTVVGKLVAVCLMFGGIALIGVVSATLASWIVERVTQEEEAEEEAITALQFDELREEIRSLRLELQKRSDASADAPAREPPDA
ncbi:potassium channel family protein [Gryllotalpicola daejeonensis]|uniref:Potassium channel family protein n=1 Tax=Gryllotalpicola daejeonensis TaxID=993087 RepID=A0ABP7ZD42_9MICO